MKKKLFEQVYEVVRQIPSGKVATYGQIGELVNSSSASTRVNPKMVGWALHANRDTKTPCHRVVNREGRLAPNFAFNGEVEQRRRLEVEGITFKDITHVNLEKHIWQVK